MKSDNKLRLKDLRSFFSQGPSATQPNVFANRIHKAYRNRHDFESIERSGTMSALLKERLVRRSLSRFKQTALGNSASLEIESTFRTQRNTSRCTTSVEFSKYGELIASSNNDGSLFLHNHSNFKESTGVRYFVQNHLEALSWNPRMTHEIACVSGLSKDLYLVNTETGHIKNCPVSREDGRRYFVDVKFSPTQNRLLTCNSKSEVHVWDQRQQLRVAVAVMAAPSSFRGLNCLETSGDSDEVLMAGTDTSSIFSWDLRMSRSASAFSTSSYKTYPALPTISLRHLFDEIPTLRRQANFSESTVDSIAVNPYNKSSLGFHLQNGWSGAVNMLTLELSHGHFPPPPWLVLHDDQVPSFSDLLLVRRRCCWFGSHSVYLVPSGASKRLHALDFGSATSQYVLNVQADEDGTNVRRLWNDVIKLDKLSACVAAHPLSDDVIAGCNDGLLAKIQCS